MLESKFQMEKKTKRPTCPTLSWLHPPSTTKHHHRCINLSRRHAVVLEDEGAELQSLDEAVGVRVVHVLREAAQRVKVTQQGLTFGAMFWEAEASTRNDVWFYPPKV